MFVRKVLNEIRECLRICASVVEEFFHALHGDRVVRHEELVGEQVVVPGEIADVARTEDTDVPDVLADALGCVGGAFPVDEAGRAVPG